MRRSLMRKFLSRRKNYWILGLVSALALIALALHVFLPSLLLKKLNSDLESFSPTYSVHIAALDLHLLRMAYSFEGIEAKFKKNGQTFLRLNQLDISVSWKELLRGKVLADVSATGGSIALTKALIAGSSTDEARPEADSKHVANKLFPIRIARVDLHQCEVGFSQLISHPEIQWRLSEIEAKILNLTPTKSQPVTFFTLKGVLLDSAALKIAGKAETLEAPLAWKTDIELQDFDLVRANPILVRLLPLTFTRGHLDVFSEVRSQNGELQGYIKPFLKKVQVIENQEHFKSFNHFAIELLTGLTNAILRKSDDKTVATKIPFHMENGSLKVGKTEAVTNAIQHGFKEPIAHDLEDSLNLKNQQKED